tara:strand:- start:637 stop:786 length:150 start_codon:yes stop_codon:yes gene_type:complete
MDKLKKKTVVTGKTPEHYLYEQPKKDRPATDKDLFVMLNKKLIKKKNKK